MHCRAQLGELSQHIWQFQRVAVPVLAVSSDDPRGVQCMDALVSREFPIVSDRRLKLISTLGLTDRDPKVDHQIARPSAFGVGSDGSIRYRFVGRDEADRPPSALLILAAERLATDRD